MAKQTFTTGQVLTAAQMTSLQQTAMLGGAASAKTASYTLVAADAGTAISMSNASATTITVNTALFAAGDTVQITNLGAGVCTITAGTATVNSSASLALAQYESGTLDFTSTSAAIFIKGAGAAAASGGMTLISTTTLSGASVTIGSIPSGYQQLVVRGFDITNNTAAGYLRGTPTGSTNICSYSGVTPAGSASDRNQTYIDLIGDSGNTYIRTGGNNIFTLTIDNYASTTAHKSFFVYAGGEDNITSFYGGYIKTDSAITSLDFDNTGGTFSAGTIQIYGVK